jgi:voltage-gated potassium channel
LTLGLPRTPPSALYVERLLMSPTRRLLSIAAVLLAVIAAGTIGYMVIEDRPFLDALFMTVTTISTVGYEEVFPLSTTGRIYTIFLIVGGVGIMFYSVGIIVQYFVENQLANLLGGRRMKQDISKLKDHIIICGYGQVGKEVALTLSEERVPFVVIDNSEESIKRASEDGYLCVRGNATTDEILGEAGIQQARGLVAAVGGDADNIFITLSAKGLRHDLPVVARASAEESESKLRRAGADRVILPLRLGGRRMAMIALHPLVVDFVETTIHSRDRDFVLEEIRVASGSPTAGMNIRQVQETSGGASILAVKKQGGPLLANPAPDTLLEPGDEVVVMGTRQQLGIFERTK